MGREPGIRADVLEALLGEIAQSIQSTAPGGSPRRSTFLITGAGGSGKTALLNALAERADPEGLDLRTASGEPTTTGRPGAVLRHLLPELDAPARSTSGHAVDALPPPDETAPGPIRHALATAGELAAERPLVLLLDDAHLADSLSLSILARLSGAGARTQPTMIIARRGIPTRGALSMLAGAPHVREFELRPLTDADTLRLARARLGAPPGPALAAALIQTGGNPAHINRVLDWVQFRDRLRPTPDGDAVDADLSRDEMVEVLSLSVDAQLRLLDPDALQTVRLVAVWERPVTAAEIGMARRQHPSEFVGGIDAAVGAGILVWEGEHIRFASRIAADAVRAGLDPPIRQLLRTAVGAATGRTDADDDATSPILRIQSSLQIGAQLPPPPRPAAGTVTAPTDLSTVLARATMLSDAGRLAEAYELASHALPAQTDPTDKVTLLFTMLSFATLSGRVGLAHDAIGAMRALPLPPESTAWISEIEVWLGAMTGDPPRGETLAALAAIDDAPPGLTGHRTARAVGMTVSGDCVGALALLDSVIDSNASHNGWMGAESPEAAAWPLWVTRFAYGPSSALTRAPVDGARDNRLVNRWLGPFRQGVIAESHLSCGELDIAAMLLDDALAEARRIESGWMSTAVADRALIDVHRGAAPAALKLIGRWREGGYPDRFGLRDVDLAAAEAHLAVGDTPAAAEGARRVWHAAKADRHLSWMIYRAPMLMRQAVLTGQTGLADAIAADVTGIAPGIDAPALHGQVLLTAAIAAEDPAGAEAAAGAFQSVGDQIGELAALEEAACLSAVSGDQPAARTLAHRTSALAERIGSVVTQRRLRKRLREAGIVLGQAGGRGGPAAGLQSLTRAEMRVCRLVAQGMTSPRIAEQLGISPRTVQTHISHVLTKLDLSTRTEIAAYLTAEGG